MRVEIGPPVIAIPIVEMPIEHQHLRPLKISQRLVTNVRPSI
jgi:hypothetical protein